VHALDVDRLPDTPSPIQRLDPRTKALLTLAFVVAVVRTPSTELWKLGIYAAFALAAILGSRVPLRFVARRALAALPFLVFIAIFTPFQRGVEPLGTVSIGPVAVTFYREPLRLTAAIVGKAALSVLAVSLLVSTTRFHRLIAGLERLKVPRALCLTLLFLHRYLFVLVEEVSAMRRARDARHVGRLGLRRAVLSAAGMVGALLVRTIERAERVAAAMRARGFDGEVRTLVEMRLAPRDALAAAVVVAFVATVTALGAGGTGS